jgi:hypothetical protein
LGLREPDDARPCCGAAQAGSAEVSPHSANLAPMTIHVFTASLQDATDFTDDGHRFTCPPLALRYCYGCRKRRRAKNLQVQCFYDSTRFWCRDKSKCKRS